MKENETPEVAPLKDKKNTFVSAMFNGRESAEKGYRTLAEKGYDNQAHVIMSHETHTKHFKEDKHAPDYDTHTVKKATDFENKAKEGAGIGGAIGIGIGAMTGAVLALGTNILVPGLGVLIAGPFLAGLAGAGAGGLAGGLIGALVGVGIHEDYAKKYEHGIRNGHIVLGVKALNEQDAIYIENEWKQHKGVDVIRS
jgi:hypothetical protein